MSDTNTEDTGQADERETITMMNAPIYLKYHYTAGAAPTRFLHAISEGKIVGQRCEGREDVYVPPRGSCPKYGEPTSVDVELPDTGVIESFTIVHIPIPGNPLKPPFVVANIVLDGAALSFIHLVSDVDPAEVRIGMHMEAVWKPREEWTHSFENIAYFRPTGQPDVDIDALQEQRRA